MTYEVREATFRTPAGHPITMAYRDHTNDWNTLNSSLNEDEYGLPSGLPGLGVDVGGYLGSVGIALALDNPMRVIIIEPVPANADLIERNIERNGVADRVTLIRGAVGSGSVSVGYAYHGSEVLTHHAFVGNSTLATDDDPHETVVYRGITLSSLVRKYGDIAVLKIDCEGGEWDFLASPALSRVGLILGEWHHGDRQAGMTELLGQTHRVTFSGASVGVGGFTAVPA